MNACGYVAECYRLRSEFQASVIVPTKAHMLAFLAQEQTCELLAPPKFQNDLAVPTVLLVHYCISFEMRALHCQRIFPIVNAVSQKQRFPLRNPCCGTVMRHRNLLNIRSRVLQARPRQLLQSVLTKIVERPGDQEELRAAHHSCCAK